jgi:hypothetical protein
MNQISCAATGNVTADPQLRFTGRAAATIPFAVDTRRRTAGGEWGRPAARLFHRHGVGSDGVPYPSMPYETRADDYVLRGTDHARIHPDAC